MRCAKSNRRSFAGPADVSPTATTGRMEWARRRSVLAAQISGRASNSSAIREIFRRNTIPINSAPMNLCIFANWGSEPYLAANLRSLPVEDFYRWIEYCNSPVGSTTLADLRAAGGDRDPFAVRYWGVGNESWGCGGDFTPSEY